MKLSSSPVSISIMRPAVCDWTLPSEGRISGVTHGVSQQPSFLPAIDLHEPGGKVELQYGHLIHLLDRFADSICASATAHFRYLKNMHHALRLLKEVSGLNCPEFHMK